LLYKFLGKKGALYQLDPEPISMKLNFKCPFGTNGNNFSCGENNNDIKEPTNPKFPDRFISVEAFSEPKPVEGMFGKSNIGYAIKKIAYPTGNKLSKNIPVFSKVVYEVLQIDKNEKTNKNSYYTLETVDNLKDAKRMFDGLTTSNKYSRFKSIKKFKNEPVNKLSKEKVNKNGSSFAQQSYDYIKSKNLHGYDKANKPITDINIIEQYTRYSRDMAELVVSRPELDYTKTYKSQDEFEDALEKAGYDSYIPNHLGEPKYDYKTANNVAELHNLIEGNKIPTDMLLYSGISNDLGKQLPTTPGDVFVNPNFLSTSWKKTVAKQFGSSVKENVPGMLEIIARKDTPALGTEVWQDNYPNTKEIQWMKGEHGFIDNPDKLEKYGGKNSQREVILNSGQKYRVLEYDNSGKVPVLRVETISTLKE
jgi:hypothetical protein